MATIERAMGVFGNGRVWQSDGRVWQSNGRVWQVAPAADRPTCSIACVCTVRGGVTPNLAPGTKLPPIIFGVVILQCIFISNDDDILDKKINLILLDILKQLLNSNGKLLHE